MGKLCGRSMEYTSGPSETVVSVYYGAAVKCKAI